ncbi:MAG: biotin/lipoyl-binding protein, partial [Gammaproteobacteria bacterium]|nr:biotin/lipoyl-binding protein [Gammaproteobacteria bacterium]
MRKLIIFVAIFAVVAGLVSWKKIQGDHTSLLVNSDVVTEQVLSDSILASGNLIFNTQIQIRSEVTGIVTNVYVEEGQYVEQGQVLMQLDQTAFAADVANYQAAVNAQRIEIEQAVEVNRDFQRRLKLKRKLYLQQLVGEDDVQRLQSQANIARIKVKAANERLNQNLATLAYAQ